jgi:outer membrane protein assembly factor BamB
MIKDGLVIFASWDKNIYALSLDGQLVWKCLTNGINLTTHAVFNKTLFTGSFDKNIYAINCEDGKIRWQYNTNGIVLTIPIVHKEIVYFGSLDNNLYALNEADGTLVWKFRSGGSITASPTIVNNVLYLGCGDTNLYTINTETRGIIWSFQTGLGTQSDVKKSIAVVEEFDKQVFKIWKPETDVIGDDEPTEDMALSDLNFAGELRYGASNPYQAKRKSYKDVPQYIKRSSNKKSG